MRPMSFPTSPCVKICRVDPAAQICTGCGRTLAEIAAWSLLDEAQRRAILQRLASADRPATPKQADA